MTVAPGSELSAIEIASGLVFGVEARSPRERPLDDLLRTLEEGVRVALLRPPCLVSFSGGRDSSCVLALATHVARREGLPLPVPVTLRFPELPEADEDEWQERVVGTLGLDDWLRLEPGSDLDAIGPVATATLRRHGLLWPFNAYVHVPMLQAARSGSLLTGVGGDELLEHMLPSRWHAVLARRARPQPRDALRLAFAGAPWRARRIVLRRRCPLRLPWLTRAGSTQLAEAWATESAREPRRLTARADWWSRRRALRLAVRSLERLAADDDVLLVNPLAARALAVGIHGDHELAFADRAGRLAAIFGDLLPRDVYERRSKASFNRAFFGTHAREFVDGWDGSGFDSGLVDSEALRRTWADEVPDGRTFTLLQSIWMTSLVREPRPSETEPRTPTAPSG